MYLVDGTSLFEKRHLYLILALHEKTSDAKLRFFNKNILAGGEKTKRNTSDIYSFDKNDSDEYLIVGRTVKMTQDFPSSTTVREDVRSRFISLESDTGLKQNFYTLTNNDAELLLCGLKILFEKNDEVYII